MPSNFTGKDLIDWRKKRGWKRTFLAQQLDVSATTLWYWEKLPFIEIRDALAIRAVDMNLKPMGD
jgi:hypothetical protein